MVSAQYHVITSAAVGGQSGKSALALMLTAYLNTIPQSHTVAVIDIASPRIGIYDCFANIFNISNEPFGYVNGSPFLKAPKLDERSSRNLIVVQVPKQNITTWSGQVSAIDTIHMDLVNRGFNVSHIIVETNLQPDADGVPLVFQDLKYSFMAFWTVWLPVAMASSSLYEFLDEIQVYETPDKPVQWHYVHNPHLQVIGRDENGVFPTMESCYGLSPSTYPMRNSDFLPLATRTRNSQSQGDEFWQDIYGEYIDKKVRPLNLLPVFHRSEALMRVMERQFRNVPEKLEDPQDLWNLLDDYSDSMYSRVFSKYFTKMRF